MQNKIITMLAIGMMSCGSGTPLFGVEKETIHESAIASKDPIHDSA